MMKLYRVYSKRDDMLYVWDRWEQTVQPRVPYAEAVTIDEGSKHLDADLADVFVNTAFTGDEAMAGVSEPALRRLHPAARRE